MSFMFRRKTETKSFSERSKQGTTTIASPCPVQGPYAFSDITRLPHTVLDGRMTAKRTEYSCSPSLNSLCDDYENVTSVDRESGFVSNDIYESCRAQSQQCHSQTGWVENEIYGWFHLYSLLMMFQWIPGKNSDCSCSCSCCTSSWTPGGGEITHVYLDLNSLWFTRQKHANQLYVSCNIFVCCDPIFRS